MLPLFLLLDGLMRFEQRAIEKALALRNSRREVLHNARRNLLVLAIRSDKVIALPAGAELRRELSSAICFFRPHDSSTFSAPPRRPLELRMEPNRAQSRFSR